MTEPQNLVPCPKAYSNGFQVGFSLTECSIVFFLVDNPTIQVFLPLAVASDLAENLNGIIAQYEKSTGMAVPKMSELKSKMDIEAK